VSRQILKICTSLLDHTLLWLLEAVWFEDRLHPFPQFLCHCRVDIIDDDFSYFRILGHIVPNGLQGNLKQNDLHTVYDVLLVTNKFPVVLSTNLRYIY